MFGGAYAASNYFRRWQGNCFCQGQEGTAGSQGRDRACRASGTGRAARCRRRQGRCRRQWGGGRSWADRASRTARAQRYERNPWSHRPRRLAVDRRRDAALWQNRDRSLGRSHLSNSRRIQPWRRWPDLLPDPPCDDRQRIRLYQKPNRRKRIRYQRMYRQPGNPTAPPGTLCVYTRLKNWKPRQLHDARTEYLWL